MSTITSTQSTTQSSSLSSAVDQTTQPTAEQQSLGEDAFLKLLVAQLKNQNPLNPMDNTAFVAQLAQFSQVEQSTKLVKLMQQNLDQQDVAMQIQKVGLIGHQVKINGSLVQLGTGPASITYSLGADAASVTVSVLDAGNQPIRTMTFSGQPAGTQQVLWDGKDNNGQTMPAGTYGFSVVAKDMQGNAVTATPSSLLTVTGVRMGTNGGDAVLLAGSQMVNASDVTEVY